MKRTALLAAAFLWIPAFGCGPRQEAPRSPALAAGGDRAGEFRLHASNAPALPRMGENDLMLAVTDTSGQPAKGLRLDVEVSMPAMGSMPRMESHGKVEEVGPGNYRVRYGIGMQGDWDVAVRVQAPGGPEQGAAYRLSTTREGVTFMDDGAASAGPADTSARPGAGEGAPVRLSAERRQAIGIRTEKVVTRDLHSQIQVPARVEFDETRTADVALKFSGFVRELQADFVGRRVRAGETLMKVYSPEILAAEQEYLSAMVAERAGATVEGGLAEAARTRLRLLGIGPDQLRLLAETRKAPEVLSIPSPTSGVVTQKNVVSGSSFQAGQALLRIQPTDPVWVLAEIPQASLGAVRIGMQVHVRQPSATGGDWTGRVSFISPSLTGDSRTGEVRIQVPNPRGDLKPGMFLQVDVGVALGRQIAVPVSAVIFSGDRRIVFVDLGDGRLEPRNVKLGGRAGDSYAVLSGLKDGDVIVTSGNFLLASESNIKSAIQGYEESTK